MKFYMILFSVFAYWRTRDGGVLCQKRTGALQGGGGPNFADFERTYFMDGP